MAHFVTIGNEKGGTGKSTLAITVSVALSRLGYRVSVIDLDLRQQSLARFCMNRAASGRREGVTLQGPVFRELAPLRKDLPAEENPADRRLTETVDAIEPLSDFILLDCPGSHTRLSQLAHMLADTLITPINDSFIDFDLLAHSDPESGDLTSPAAYAEMVWNARELRKTAGLPTQDWVLARSRLGATSMHNTQKLTLALKELSARLGFRTLAGLTERVIFRELFPRGLTVLDLADIGVTNPNASNKAALEEVRKLLLGLNLPGVDRAAVQRI